MKRMYEMLMAFEEGFMANEYVAAWENYDNAGLFYHHYGIAKVTSAEQIPGRPNHS